MAIEIGHPGQARAAQLIKILRNEFNASMWVRNQLVLCVDERSPEEVFREGFWPASAERRDIAICDGMTRGGIATTTDPETLTQMVDAVNTYVYIMRVGEGLDCGAVDQENTRNEVLVLGVPAQHVVAAVGPIVLVESAGGDVARVAVADRGPRINPACRLARPVRVAALAKLSHLKHIRQASALDMDTYLDWQRARLPEALSAAVDEALRSLGAIRPTRAAGMHGMLSIAPRALRQAAVGLVKQLDEVGNRLGVEGALGLGLEHTSGLVGRLINTATDDQLSVEAYESILEIWVQVTMSAIRDQ